MKRGTALTCSGELLVTRIALLVGSDADIIIGEIAEAELTIASSTPDSSALRFFQAWKSCYNFQSKTYSSLSQY